MKNTKLLLLFLVFNSFIFCQNKEVDILNKDLNYLKKVLFTSHPSAFRYISKDSLETIFDSLKFTPKDEATKLNLEKKVRIILSKIGCAHTSVKKTSFKFSKKTIPFEIYSKNNKTWITRDLEDSLSKIIGSKILSINGHDSYSIIEKMKNYRASDGYNTTFKYQLINNQKQFSNLYQYYFDKDSIKTYILLNNELDTIVIQRKIINYKFKKKKAIDKLVYF